ncbi:lichenan-specific phosphotransferase enzyme IIB component [Clostridium puniceum]|uniref:Lichenan-specific phosphotransferase enzyme IIB component n=1 Tax=Clostridium puniceum TaxID=29367 RepID=A0A1S8T7S0_9CLOT|nr:PTS sugar transporter subunit IIB [Clostridium puniceum]OOM73664.1 lichenan-specific phosphotransferase enzyme IIB component [Clostridium puniceum]
MNILLSCCAGMSTSILVEGIIQECERQGKDYNIKTVDQGILKDEIDGVDVILLAPQVRHILKRVEKMAKGRIPIGVIRVKDYGQLDATAVLKYAEELFENHITQKTIK